MRRAAIVTLATLTGLWLAVGLATQGSVAALPMSWVGTDHLPLVVGLFVTLVALAVGGGTPERR